MFYFIFSSLLALLLNKKFQVCLIIEKFLTVSIKAVTFSFIVAYVAERVDLEVINIDIHGEKQALISLNDFYICCGVSIRNTNLSMFDTVQLVVNLLTYVAYIVN